MTCRNGGIGRRSGLKIRRRQKRAGSTPAFGTRKDLDIIEVFSFYHVSYVQLGAFHEQSRQHPLTS